MRYKNLILVGLVFVAVSTAFADFGQSAGALDFGKLQIGENKTLSYFLINTGNETLQFEMIYPNNTMVAPENGTIKARGQQLINVTVIANEVGDFNGVIKAKAIENLTGTVVFNVELDKNFNYIVEKEKSSGDTHNICYILAIAIFLISFEIYYHKLKGGKKIWKRGK